MKSKKIVSMFLALVMALALAVPAMAEDVKVDGTMNLPTINVVLPTTTGMIMNPYALSVKLDPKAADDTAVQDQILSPLMTVKNLSNIGIQVGITVKGSHGKGTGAFASATTQGATKSTDKEAFVYAKFLIGDPTMGLDDIEAEATAPTADKANLVIIDESDDGKEVTNFKSTDSAAATNTLVGTTGKTPAEDGVLGFRFFGDMTSAPVDDNEASIPWTEKDVLSVTVSFTFTPVANSLPADPATT